MLPTPTATLPPTRTPRPTEVPLQIFTDVTYTLSNQPDVKDRVLDIYAPEQSGEWSVIIIAHGFIQSKDAFVRMAKILAREGAVVFVPEWPAYAASSDAMEGSGEKLREFTETFNCLVRFARKESAAYTNTPERVTMVGYSMGGWLGLLT